ncbi:hypothetical protein XK97_08610 [Obesumbacterium proteus]|nr:hypothetical protein XK97_08610 [Obesumbacterium proteus]
MTDGEQPAAELLETVFIKNNVYLKQFSLKTMFVKNGFRQNQTGTDDLGIDRRASVCLHFKGFKR